jgi:anti-sigma factor RsiW
MTSEECPRMEALSALVDEALAPPEHARIAGHAASCPVCGATLADLKALRARFAALPEPRVGFDLAPLVEGRIRAAERAPRARPARKHVPWWQLLPAAVGAAAALGAGGYLGSFLVAGVGGASRAAVQMSAFDTVPPGGICLGPACGGGGR